MSSLVCPDDKLDLMKAFAKEYFTNGFDAINALETVYKDDRPQTKGGLATKAKSMLNNYLVRQEIDRLSMEAVKTIDDDIPRIALELKALAYFDPMTIFTDDGDLKPLSEIPEASRRALASLEVNAIVDREGCVIGHNKKIKLNDKLKALRMLGEWKKMFVTKVEHSASEDMAALILDARRRYAAGLLPPIEVEVVRDVLPQVTLAPAPEESHEPEGFNFFEDEEDTI